GGVVQDLPPGALEQIREFLRQVQRLTRELHKLMDSNPVFTGPTKNIVYLDLECCMALPVAGRMLRSAGLPWDLRKSQPYSGYETYEFDVPTRTTCDTYGRYQIRMDEVDQSLRIIEQCVDRLGGERAAEE